MEQFSSVLAFGDSNVAGCELGDLSQVMMDNYFQCKITMEEMDEYWKKFAFPQIVADKLNIPCYNYSLSGGSNERSLRLLTTAIQQHPNSLVLFGYTSTDRTEFYYPEHGSFYGRDKDNFLQVGMQWEHGIQAFTKMTHPINSLFVDKFLYPYNNLDQIIYIVNALCKVNNTRVINLPLFPWFHETISTLDNVFDFEGHGNYMDWGVNNNFKPTARQHFKQDAHNKLAELIIKQLLS